MAYGNHLGNPLGNPLGIPRSAISSISAVGTVMAHAGMAAANELPADGRSLLKDNYSALYRAIGDAYTQAVTTNSFTTVSLSATATWVSVAYGNGLFIAISSTGLSAVSSDFGATWQAGGALPAATYTGIAYGGGVFVAIATGVAFSVSTTDGAVWTQRVMPSAAAWSSIAYGGGRFVAFGGNIANGAGYSLDGIAWVASNNTAGIGTGQSRMAYGSGRFVVGDLSNNSAYVSSTADGVVWTSSALPTARRVTGLAYGNGFFVATSNTTGAAATYSLDGLSWFSGTATGLNLLAAFAFGRFFLFPVTGQAVVNFDLPEKFGIAITSPANSYNQSYAVGGGYMVVLSTSSLNLVARISLLPATSFNLPSVQALDPDKTAFVRVS